MMITPLKSNVTDKLSALYSRSAKLRIATDDGYNILWQSHTKKECTVTFYDIGGKAPEDGMIRKVFVDELCMSAECEAVNIDGETLFMWTIHSATELAAQINCISSYKDIAFLFNTLKSNIDELKQWIEDRTDMIPDCGRQLISCDAMTEQVFILERISAVMYDRRQEPLDLYHLVLGTARACNRFLKKRGHRISILTMQAQTLMKLLICGEPLMLSSALFCLIKRAVCYSGEKQNMLFMSHNEKSISITTRYMVTKSSIRSYITDDFELNSAKLYIELIGGRLILKRDKYSERIKVTLPLYEQEDTFNSSKLCLSRSEFDRLAKVILTGINF